MDFRALRYFTFIAEARSFSQASAQLRIAQPALSRQVRKLESELGVALFIRTGRHLELTEAGTLLLQRAHALIQQAREAADDVRSQARELSGAVSVGISPAASEPLGPLIVRAVTSRHPRLRVNLVEGFSGFIFERLTQNEISMCVLHNPPPQQGIEYQPLVAEPLLLVGPTASRSLPPARPTLRLEAIPLILPNPTHGLRRLIDKALGPKAERLTIAAQVDGFVATRALVAAGVGYTVLPFSAVASDVERGDLSAVRLRDIDITWTITLAWRHDARLARRLEAVKDAIEDEMRSFRGSRRWPGEGHSILVGERAR